MNAPLAPSDRLRPRLDAARALADEGDLMAAERDLQRLLDAPFLESPHDRWFVLSSLMTIYGRTGRRYATLILGRYLTDVLRNAGYQPEACGCLATYCECVLDSAAGEVLRERVCELGELLRPLPETQAGMAREAFHHCRFQMAIADTDLAAARYHAGEFARFNPPQEGRPWRKPLQTLGQEIDISLLSQRPMEALDALDRARAVAGSQAEALQSFRILERKVHTAAGNAEPAEAAARSLLEILEHNQSAAGRPFQAVPAVLKLIDWFMERPGFENETRRACDVAVTVVVEQLAQLDRLTDQVPELGMDAGAATDDLAALRRNFVSKQSAVHARFAAQVSAHPDVLERLLVTEGKGEALIHLCAWCESVLTPQGTWLPIGHFVPRTGTLPISHGICERCLDRERGRGGA